MHARRVRAEEWRELRDLRLRALIDYPGPLPDALALASARTDDDWREWGADCASGDRSAVFVVHDFSGMAGVELDESGTPVLYGMWVAPIARGRSLGRALAEAAIAWARESGEVRMTLWVASGNEPARALYERLGFRPTGAQERRGADLDEEMAIRL